MGQIKNIKLHIVTDIKLTENGRVREKATQMVGLAVAKTPRETLLDLYAKTLTAVGALPKTSPYRQQVETLTQERQAMVSTTTNVFSLEKEINAGQIEEVIIQAQDELSLVNKMAEWQAWETLETAA